MTADLVGAIVAGITGANGEWQTPRLAANRSDARGGFFGDFNSIDAVKGTDYATKGIIDREERRCSDSLGHLNGSGRAVVKKVPRACTTCQKCLDISICPDPTPSVAR